MYCTAVKCHKFHDMNMGLRKSTKLRGHEQMRLDKMDLIIILMKKIYHHHHHIIIIIYLLE